MTSWCHSVTPLNCKWNQNPSKVSRMVDLELWNNRAEVQIIICVWTKCDFVSSYCWFRRHDHDVMALSVWLTAAWLCREVISRESYSRNFRYLLPFRSHKQKISKPWASFLHGSCEPWSMGHKPWVIPLHHGSFLRGSCNPWSMSHKPQVIPPSPSIIHPWIIWSMIQEPWANGHSSSPWIILSWIM